MVSENPNLNRLEIVKEVKIPQEEMKAVLAVRDFVNDLYEQEDENSVCYPEGTRAKIDNLFQEKIDTIESNGFLSPDEKLDLGRQARSAAQYEVCKDVVEYKNNQLKKLLAFIESQNIWKVKFTTASNAIYNLSAENPDLDFIQRLDKSEEMHSKYSFAGQNLNSIYYMSPSGMVIRIKPAALHPDGNIHDVLASSSELFTCSDETPDEKGIYHSGTYEINEKLISFEPKKGYRVDDFYTMAFPGKSESEFHSKIKVLKQKGKILIKGYDDMHLGHCINKIEEL